MPIPRDQVKQVNKNDKGNSGNSSSSSPVLTFNEDDHDFTLESEITPRMNVAIAGGTGVGKTSFITRYCPSPICLIYYDGRSEVAINEGRDLGKKIWGLDIPFDADILRSEEEGKRLARDIIRKTYKNLKWAVGMSLQGQMKTIAIDGGTELSQIFDLGFDGVVEDRPGKYGKDFSYVDSQWRRIFSLLYQSKAHFIVTTRTKEIYKDNEGNDGKTRQVATGEFDIRGPKVIGELCTWAAHLSLSDSPIQGVIARKKKDLEALWQLKMIKSGRNGTYHKAEFDRSDWNPGDNKYGPFAWISYLQNKDLVDCKPEDWL